MRKNIHEKPIPNSIFDSPQSPKYEDKAKVSSPITSAWYFIQGKKERVTTSFILKWKNIHFYRKLDVLKLSTSDSKNKPKNTN